MAGFFGSMAHMPVRTASGRIGYTSKRRREAIEGMGYQLDSDGFVVGAQTNPNTGMIAGTNQRPGQQAAAGVPVAGWNPMASFQQGLGGLLNMPGAFARPGAMQALAGMFGQPVPAWGMGSYMPSGPVKPQMSTPLQVGSNPFAASLSQLLGGSTSISGGARGPAPAPFNYLRRFAGPYGNGGGPIAPVPGMHTAAYQ